MGPVCTKQENAPNSKFELFCCEMQLSARRGGTLKILSKFSACHFVKQRGGRGPSPKSFPAQDSSAKAAAMYFEEKDREKRRERVAGKRGGKYRVKAKDVRKVRGEAKRRWGGISLRHQSSFIPAPFFSFSPRPCPSFPPCRGGALRKGGAPHRRGNVHAKMHPFLFDFDEAQFETKSHSRRIRI